MERHPLQLQRIRTRHLRKPLPISTYLGSEEQEYPDPNDSAGCNKLHCLKWR